jgi:hypothetical protein
MKILIWMIEFVAVFTVSVTSISMGVASKDLGQILIGGIFAFLLAALILAKPDL